MAAPIEIDTEDKLEYRWYPVSNGIIQFRVRAPNDAHLALCANECEADPMYEVFLGGWKNTKSVIRKNRTKPDIEADTPDILNDGEFRGFWIRWMDNTITVGHEGQVAAFLTFEDSEAIPINYVGVCTGWGACGSWIIEAPQPSAPGIYPRVALMPMAMAGGTGPVYWAPASGTQVPPEAIQGGMDGEPLYIGRAKHEGALIPGKVVPSHGVCYVAWGGAEHPISEYEVLCGASGTWIQCSGSDIPGLAFAAGETEDGEPLFIGRAHHEGTITVGKIQPSHGSCYIPFGGQEVAFTDYEVFVTQ
jgi:hypothetical protein